MGYATQKFAARLKQLRETAGLTQEQFAKELKVSRGAISYYEKGDRTPDIEFLDSLYSYFNCTLPYDFLLGDTDNVKEEHRNMYEFYGLTDKACDKLERDEDIGHLISVILEHKNFYDLEHTYKSIIKHYKTFSIKELGYVSFLISDALNKIIFDSIEVLMDFQYTPEEREALRIKYAINQEEFEKKMKEWDEKELLQRKKWAEDEKKLKEQIEEEYSIRNSAIDKIHEKFYQTVNDLEFERQYP